MNTGARHAHVGDALTPAEERVAACLAEGMTTLEICGVVCRSLSTVETHIERIRAKVGATNNRRLVSMLARTGLREALSVALAWWEEARNDARGSHPTGMGRTESDDFVRCGAALGSKRA